MNPSIGVAVNFFNEKNTLPGFLEMASQFFDEILMVDCGPGDELSTDGSIDILRQWGIEPLKWKIDEGFGKVRTQLIHTIKTDWVAIMDCDERLRLTSPVYHCDGTEEYPGVKNPNLKVSVKEPSYNHRDFLFEKIREADRKGATSIRASRRHWFDLSYKKPTQNWLINRDWQLRIWKALPYVGYKSEVKMHEQGWDWKRNCGPIYVEDDLYKGPFFDHFHLHFKAMEPEQRKRDIEIFDALHKSDTHLA